MIMKKKALVAGVLLGLTANIFSLDCYAEYGPVINNNSNMTISDDIWYSVSQINNGINGNLKITGNFGTNYTSINNKGEITFKGNYQDLSTAVIHNEGVLHFDSRDIKDASSGRSGAFVFSGEYYHEGSAITDINLRGLNNVNAALFEGSIYGSNENFSMKLGPNAYWFTDGKGSLNYQNEPVYGINLCGGGIIMSDINYIHNIQYHDLGYQNKRNWSWPGEKLTLINFKCDGTGYIQMSTDLIRGYGDKLILQGTVPDKLPLLIVNRNDHDGKPISPDEGYRVNVVDAPKNSNIDVFGSVYVYPEITDSSITTRYHTDVSPILYKAIFEEETLENDLLKKYYFVGWQEEGYKTVNEEIKQTNIEPWINYIEIDNTLKRINDIRTDPSEVGAWLRGENGKMKIRSYGYKYNLMSGGYDWKYESDAAKMFLGFGISYAKNNCDTGIIGDTKSMGYNLYGSWLGRENNDYVDVIVKYGTLDKKYAGLDDNNVFVTGDYDKKLFSVAAKYGRRITRDDGWYYEPSVGLTWGRIGSADFTDSQGINIHADSSTSKMATLGMQVGKNIQGTEFYGLFQVRHDFDGKMHVSVPGSDLPGSSVYDDMGGTWYKVGIGAARKINKNNSFYMDIEKDFGNKVKKPYAIGAGYRYTF